MTNFQQFSNEIDDYKYIEDEDKNITHKVPIPVKSCSFTYFGQLEVKQAAFYCTSCDPFRSEFMCAHCYEECHRTCKKNIVGAFQELKFVCCCAKKFNHQQINEDEEAKPCKMKSLDLILGNQYSFYCSQHSGNYICSICHIDCHRDCQEGPFQCQRENTASCLCTNSKHRSTQHNIVNEPIQSWLMNFSSPSIEIWPLHVMNLIFSNDERFSSLSNTVSSYSASAAPAEKSKFKTIIQLFANSFQETRLQRKLGAPFKFKWNTHFFGENIVNTMFPFPRFQELYLIVRNESNWLAFRMMYIFYFISLQYDLKSIKGYSTSEFLLSHSIAERLISHRKFPSTEIYKNLQEKKLFFFKEMLQFTIENVISKYFEKYCTQYEILLKIICFMLKRMMVTIEDIIELVELLNIFQQKLFRYLYLEERKDFERRFRNVWRCVCILVKIDFLMAMTWNDLVVCNYMPGGDGREFEFIHVIDTGMKKTRKKLFQMSIQNCHSLSMYYTYSNAGCGIEPRKAKAIISIANETLKLFSLADNNFYLQLLNYEKEGDSIDIYSNDQSDAEISLMKTQLDTFLQKFFSLIPNQPAYDEFHKMLDNLGIMIHDKINSQLPNQGKVPVQVRPNTHFILSKYPHFKILKNSITRDNPLLNDLISSNLDETLSKLIIIFSDYKTSLTEEIKHPFHSGLITATEIDILLSVILLYCTNIRGIKYLLTGNTLNRLVKTLKNFCIKIENENCDDIDRAIDNGKKAIRFILEFWYILCKRIKNLKLDCECHKIISTLPHVLFDMQKNYFNNNKYFKPNEDELKIQYSLMIRILYFLALSFETEEYEKIQKKIIVNFRDDKRINFTSMSEFLQQFWHKKSIKAREVSLEKKNSKSNNGKEIIPFDSYLCCGKLEESSYREERINSQLYFALFAVLSQGTYYLYKEHEKLFDFIYTQDISVYTQVLASNTLCLKHRLALLRFIRTVYFIDRINKFDYATREKYFSTNDYLNYVYYYHTHRNENPGEEIKMEGFPTLANDEALISKEIANINIQMLKDKKKTVEKIKNLIEIFISEMEYVNNIPSIPKKYIEKMYIRELILTVHFLNDFFYIEKDIWYYLIYYFGELAEAFIEYSEQLVKNYMGESTNKVEYTKANFETEMRRTNMSDKVKIFHLLSKCVAKIYQVTENINQKTSLPGFLKYYDERMELNFSSYVIISTKDYEYFYQKKSEGRHNVPVNEYKEQFINIDKTNFLEVLGEVSTEFQLYDYRQFLVNYFFSYMKTQHCNYSFKNFECLVYILTKMLYYDTEITKQKLETLPQKDITFILESMKRIININIVHAFALAKNKFTSDKLHRLTSVTKLSIELLQMLIHTKYEREIFGIANIPDANEKIFDFSRDFKITHFPNLKVSKLISRYYDEIPQEDYTEADVSSIFTSLSSCMMKLNSMLDLHTEVDYEMPYDKLIALQVTIINFFAVFMDSKIPDVQKMIFELMKSSLMTGFFKSIYLKCSSPKYSKNKKNLVLFMKIYVVNLLNSFLRNGKDDQMKCAFVQEFIKDFPPNLLFDEIKFTFSDLLDEFNILFPPALRETCTNSKFFEALETEYMFNENFREAIQLKVCCKLFTLIQILENDYAITSVKDFFNVILKKEKMEKNNKFFSCIYKTRSKYDLKIFLILKRLVLNVEINQSNMLQRSYFVRPVLTFHLTKESIMEYQENVDRESATSKLNGLVTGTDFFMFEMVYNRNNFSRGWHYKLFQNLHSYIFHLFNYLFTITHNILLVVSYYRSTDSLERNYTEGVAPIQSYSNYWLGIIQAVFILIVMYFSRLYGPISRGQLIMRQYNKNFLIRKKVDRGKKVVPNEIRKFFTENKYPFWNNLSWWQQAYILFLSVVGNSRVSIFVLTCILLIVFYTTNHPIWIAIPTIFVICISPTLSNILKAVYLRWWQLVTVLLFTYLCIYIFMWLAMFYINDLFNLSSTEIISGSNIEENFCQSSVVCLLTMIDYGIRNGGGIGDVMSLVSYRMNYQYYIMRFFFVWLFHIIIILILSNVFLGIIVDTFGELRNRNQKREDDIKNVCFICQITKDQCLLQNIVFEDHVAEEHVMWNYIYFLTFLHTSNPHDFSSLEKYVWDMLGDQDITWIPIYSEKKAEN